MEIMNTQEFELLTGRKPEQDDLERTNCKEAGFIGHHYCGLCAECGQPSFMCVCTNEHRGENRKYKKTEA